MNNETAPEFDTDTTIERHTTFNPIGEDPFQHLTNNFIKALEIVLKCTINETPVSLILMIAHLVNEDENTATANHTVYGDEHMHLESLSQLLLQIIESGTPQHHRALRQLFRLCEAQIVKKEQEQSHG